MHFFLGALRVKHGKGEAGPIFQKGDQRDDDRTDRVGVAYAKSLLQLLHNIVFFLNLISSLSIVSLKIWIFFCKYSETCLRWPHKNRQNKGLKRQVVG